MTLSLLGSTMFLLYWICKAKAQKFTNDLGLWCYVMYVFIILVYEKSYRDCSKPWINQKVFHIACFHWSENHPLSSTMRRMLCSFSIVHIPYNPLLALLALGVTPRALIVFSWRCNISCFPIKHNRKDPTQSVFDVLTRRGWLGNFTAFLWRLRSWVVYGQISQE